MANRYYVTKVSADVTMCSLVFEKIFMSRNLFTLHSSGNKSSRNILGTST